MFSWFHTSTCTKWIGLNIFLDISVVLVHYSAYGFWNAEFHLYECQCNSMMGHLSSYNKLHKSSLLNAVILFKFLILSEIIPKTDSWRKKTIEMVSSSTVYIHDIMRVPCNISMLYGIRFCKYSGVRYFSILYKCVSLCCSRLVSSFSHPHSAYRDPSPTNLVASVTIRAASMFIFSNLSLL